MDPINQTGLVIKESSRPHLRQWHGVGGPMFTSRVTLVSPTIGIGIAIGTQPERAMAIWNPLVNASQSEVLDTAHRLLTESSHWIEYALGLHGSGGCACGEFDCVRRNVEHASQGGAITSSIVFGNNPEALLKATGQVDPTSGFRIGWVQTDPARDTTLFVADIDIDHQASGATWDEWGCTMPSHRRGVALRPGNPAWN